MKGIQCNVAAQVEGVLNTSEQSILNEITTKPSKSNTKTLKKKVSKETCINLSSEPTQIHFIKFKKKGGESKIVCNAQALAVTNGWSISTFVSMSE